MFLIVMVYVVAAPARTVATPSVLVIDRSAVAPTSVSSVSMLFPGTGSSVAASTIATFEIVPGVVGVTVIVMVAVADTRIAPSGQVTTPAAWEQEP